MRILTIALFTLFSLATGMNAQVYDQPNYSLTSHPTLDIISVERWEDQMVLTLTLKNERYSGFFCLDSNTFLRNSLGEEEYRLVRMEGIPACPDVYRFKSIGERITIVLEFPAIPDDVARLTVYPVGQDSICKNKGQTLFLEVLHQPLYGACRHRRI